MAPRCLQVPPSVLGLATDLVERVYLRFVHLSLQVDEEAIVMTGLSRSPEALGYCPALH